MRVILPYAYAGYYSLCLLPAQEATFNVRFEKCYLEQAIAKVRSAPDASIVFHKEDITGLTVPAQVSGSNRWKVF